MKLNGDYLQDMAQLAQCKCYEWGENILRVLPNSHNARPRRIYYAGIGRWDDCQNGIFALCWMLYPDGQYFADSDGYGGEDNDELMVYCVMNDNLEVIRPFTIVRDMRALLNQLRETN